MSDEMEKCWRECVHGNDTYYHEDFKRLKSHEDYFKAGYNSSLQLLHERDCHIEELEHKLEMAIEALESIAKNTCCTPCQEAKKVATRTLEQLK